MQTVSPDPIVQAISGYMTAKYLFVASEMGLFEALVGGMETLSSLSEKTGIPVRTLRMVLDALAATGFLQRQGDAYRNTPVTAAYLSGEPGMDLRPRLRLWDKVVYAQWATLEEAIRTGKRTYGLPEFSEREHEAFNTGVSHLTAPSAKALAQQYDFGKHHSILDLAGGLGAFLTAALEPHLAVKGTLFELPATAKAAKVRLAATPAVSERITIVEGDIIADNLPAGHDAVILANIIHLFSPDNNARLLGRIRKAVAPGTRLLLVDFWINDSHTEPAFAALMAAEFHIFSGEGDVYSVAEVSAWLTGTGWQVLDHQPLAGPASLVIAEAV